MFWRCWAAAAACVLAGRVEAAQTFRIDVEGTNFVAAVGHPVPIDPLELSFDLTFDPTFSQTDDTPQTGVGVSLISANFPIDGTLLVELLQDGFGGDLSVGGSPGGLFSIPGGANDFFLDIRDITSASPTFNILSYREAGIQDSFHSTSGSVTKTVVPEPTEWALAVLGLGGVGVALRRRRTGPWERPAQAG